MRPMTRRQFVAGSGALLGATHTGHSPPVTRSSSASSVAIGDISITILRDGSLIMPSPFLATNAKPAEVAEAMREAGQRGELIEPPCNVALVKTKSEVILIDAGSGPHYMPTAGKLIGNMEAAGIDKESITKVVFTHAHPDHIWGTLDDFDDSQNFPNASYVIAAAEWNFWMGGDVASRLPADRQNFAPGARRNLSRIRDKVRTVQPGEDIAPGLRAVDTSGHTAGDIAIEVVSGTEGLLVVGDALAHPVIAFAYPNWKPAADHHDADKAVATRKRLLDRLAIDRTPIIGFHLPWPGFGRVERKGAAYAFISGA